MDDHGLFGPGSDDSDCEADLLRYTEEEQGSGGENEKEERKVSALTSKVSWRRWIRALF